MKEENVNDTDLTIYFTPSANTHIFEFIDSVEYLKLEDKDEALLAYVDKLVLRKDKIYMGDFSNHKIVVYDTTGMFLYVINQQGRGAEEYLQVKSFAVDDSCVYILDTFLPGLHVFDNRTGKFITRKKMSFIAWDFETLNHGQFVFTYCLFKDGKLAKDQPSYRLLITDSDMNVVQQMLPFEKEEGDPIGKKIYFTSNEQEVVLNWCMTDSFVILDKNYPDSLQRINIDFGSSRIPDACRKTLELISDEFTCMYETPIVNKNYIAMEIRKDDRVECCLFHRPTGQLFSNSVNDSKPYMSFPSCVDSQGRFVEVITNKVFYDEKIESGFPLANTELENHLEDGMALVIYKMRDGVSR